MRTREAALSALFTLISGAYAWKNKPSRRLKLWNDVAREQRPAFFQFEGDKQPYKWTNGAIAQRQLDLKLFIYIASSDDKPGAPQISAILDAIDQALAPNNVPGSLSAGRQSLGGTCENCRITGEITTDPGDMDGDGLIIVPIQIILP